MNTNQKKRYKAMLHLLFMRNPFKKAEYLKSSNLFEKFGDNCAWHSIKLPSEPELVKINDNVHICSNVTFITHDVICDMLNKHPDYMDKAPWEFYKGKIEIKQNCVIGANSTILYNTTIGSDTIIAAGSVVTKDVPNGEIWGGAPARKIGSFSDLAERRALRNEACR